MTDTLTNELEFGDEHSVGEKQGDVISNDGKFSLHAKTEHLSFVKEPKNRFAVN